MVTMQQISDEQAFHLAFFPEFFPDELLYSVVARYARYSRASFLQINRSLFGNSKGISHELPLHIARLVHNAGSGLNLSAENIVQRHTLLPFYTALREENSYAAFSDRMLKGENIFRSVKGSRTAVPWPDRLRYCPECDEESRRLYGTRIWLRRHQLVTSLICIQHFRVLLDSEVDVTTHRESRYIAAAKRHSGLLPIANVWSARSMERYHALTEFGYTMLHSQEYPAGWLRSSDLSALARQKGFTAGDRIDVAGLIKEFEAFHGGLLKLWPRLRSWEGRSRHWLHFILRRAHYTKNPVGWALTQIFLDQHPDSAGAVNERRFSLRTAPPPKKPELMNSAIAAEQDADLSTKIRLSAERLRCNVPPVRITKGAIVRTMPRSSSLRLGYALPMTQAALRKETEDRFQFLRRRLQWMFEDARQRGEVITLSQLFQQRRWKQNAKLTKEEWQRYYGES